MNEPKKLPAPRRMMAAIIGAAALSGMLAACSGVKPFDYTAVHEIPPGPGLISGDDGEFELYKRE